MEGSLDGHHITSVYEYDEYDVSNKYTKSLCYLMYKQKKMKTTHHLVNRVSNKRKYYIAFSERRVSNNMKYFFIKAYKCYNAIIRQIK